MPVSVPQFAAIAAASSGDNTLVAAVAGKKIRVLGFFMVAAVGTVTARFESAAGGAALTGQMPLAANTTVGPGYNPLGWFETVAGQLLNLELSGATAVAGAVTYVLVD